MKEREASRLEWAFKWIVAPLIIKAFNFKIFSNVELFFYFSRNVVARDALD